MSALGQPECGATEMLVPPGASRRAGMCKQFFQDIPEFHKIILRCAVTIENRSIFPLLHEVTMEIGRFLPV